MFKKKTPPSRPTFVSFVSMNTGDDLSSSPSLPDASDQSETTSFCSPVNSNQNDDAFELKLLSGEIVVSKIPQVTRFLPFSDGGSAVFGSIVVTNFRVAFIPLSGDTASDDMSYKSQIWNHKFIRRDDILLTNISEIYQVGKNKRKKLEKGVNVSESMNKLEIFCRDFSIHSFSLLSRESHLMKKLVTPIIQFVYPSRHELLFANSFRGPFVTQEYQSSSLPFHDRHDWSAALNDSNATGFRVTTCNTGFTLAESLPPCFVVPESLTDELILRYKLSENNKAFPIWSYTHHNGASLLRMASESVGGTEKLCIDHVHKTCTPRSRGIVSIELSPNNDSFPSTQDLQESYILLKQICMPSSNKEIWCGELAWLSALESTKWMHHISNLLSISRKVVQYISDSKKTVVIKENGGNDFTPVIACLSEMMMEPKFRTIEGFQRLIDKEWIALGHRFCERLGLISSKQKAPMFHSFLDCVLQLVSQFPHEFEFTTVYLTALYDSMFVGLFDAFIFNTPKHRMCYIHKNDKPNNLSRGRLNKSSPALQSPMDVIKLSPPSPTTAPSKTRNIMTVWDWELQYSASDIKWFKNPMFCMFSSAVLSTGHNPSRENVNQTGREVELPDVPSNARNSNMQVRNSVKKGISNMIRSCTSKTVAPIETRSVFYKSSISRDSNDVSGNIDRSPQADMSHSLSNLFSKKKDSANVASKQRSSLIPEVGMPFMKFWDHCYLRWIGPLEIIGGSHFAEYFTHVHLVLDIMSLDVEISKTERQMQLINSSDCEVSRSNCMEPNQSRVNDLKLETGVTIRHSSFYITNFLSNSNKSTTSDPVSSYSTVLGSGRKCDFPNPPDFFTSSFPYVIERPPSSFATPMTFSNESQRASYIESDLASIDEMTSSILSHS